MKSKSIFSLLLVMAMLLSMVAVPVYAEDTVALTDPGFEVNLWGGSSVWSVTFPDGDGWGTKQVEWLEYANDTYLTVPEGGESAYVKVYMADGGKLQVVQTLTNVPAGTYTVTAQSMGGGGETVAVVMGDQVGETVQTDAGYNNWTASSGTFTVEACESITVGVQVTCSASGWTSIDCLGLTVEESQEPETPEEPEQPAEMPEIALENGDFEAGSAENWVLSGYSEVSTDAWAANNGTNALNLWLSDSEAAAGSASYTVKLTAGTYRFSYDISGAAMDSGLSYAVTSGETELVKGDATAVTSGWDAWQTVTTAEFTLTETAEVTFTLSGTQPAGYFGDLDNLKLYGTGSVALDYSELTLENGDFELGNANNWVLTGYSTVATNQWATNNGTNTLDLWLSDDAEAAGAASYTVKLTAGTYYFTFDLSGGITGGTTPADSGLIYAITAGETELAKGDSGCAVNGWDVWTTESTETFTLTEDTDVTFTLAGTQPAKFFGNLDNLKLYGTGALAEKVPDPVEADIYVPRINGTGGDFMRGMDVSSVLSILNSGATFKDWDGNVLDGQGFFNLLADSGTNWVRLRVWNDPFDASGNGYGGGNCDIEAAKIMGQWATNAGMKVFVDFHYSDFWADPGKQQAPKAWASYTVDQKADAIYAYTKSSLEYLIANGVNVGMVQVGNETTNSMCGVSDWADRCTLFSAGSKAVRNVDGDILVAIHFTNPERSGNYANFAKQLDTYGVDYDIFASSYYPYWHGTLDNLTSVLKQVADTYGKYVIVAETSWAYTLEDGDGHANTVRANNNDSATYPFTVQGQATEIASVTQAVRNVGDKGIGIFYWESAWIPVGTPENLEQNKVLWEKYGSGWASSYAAEYDAKDAGVWFGGSAVDNQALFDFEGNPLASLKTYSYIQSGTTGFDIEITSVESPTLNYTIGDTLALPETVTVSFNVGADEEKAVTWSEADVAAVNMNVPGTYVVNGTIEGDVAVKCTVIVKGENLLTNPSMEESDMSMYVSSQTYAKRNTDDPYSGSYSLHFYNSGVVDFTTEQTVTLKPGHYEFSLYGQGGNVGDEAKTYAYVKLGEEVLTADFALTGWAIWVNPTISFDVTEEMAVTVGVNVTASQSGAWGTFDDWYLCEDTTPEHTGGTADCCNAAVCAACGESYGDKDAANHAGGTEVRGAVEATTEKEGYTGDTYCLGCGEKIASGEVIPKKTLSPATGDNTPVVFLTMVMISSAAAAAYLMLRKRKFL